MWIENVRDGLYVIVYYIILYYIILYYIILYYIILYHIHNSVFSFWISVLALLFIYKVFKT